MGRKVSVVGCLVAVLAVVSLSDRDRSRNELSAVLPGFRAATIAMLEAPTTDAHRKYLTAASTDRIAGWRRVICDSLYTADKLSSVQTAALRSALAALDGFLTRRRGCGEYARDSSLLASLSSARARQVVVATRSIGEVFADSSLSGGERTARIQALTSELAAAGCTLGEIDGLDRLGILAHASGDMQQAEALQRQALQLARAGGCLDWEARERGRLLMGRMWAGWTAADRDTVRELLVRTTGSRLARSSAYLITLQGYDAFVGGRYPTARAHFEDAIALCYEFGDPARSLPALDVFLRMYGALGCWPQVDELLDRADGLLVEEEAESGPSASARLSRIRHQNLRARSLAARGLVDQAHAAFRRTLAAARTLPFAEAGFIGRQWVETLLAADRPVLVREAIEELDQSAGPARRNPEDARLPFWLAWLSWREGNPAAAREHMRELRAVQQGDDATAVADLKFQALALQARLAAASEPGRAERILTRAWSALASRAAADEAGVERYLDLGRNPDPRVAAHDLYDSDPVVGYGIELLWREVLLRPQAGNSALSHGGLIAAAQRRAARAQHRLRITGATHLSYQVYRDRIVRWSVTGTDVRRDELAVSTARLRDLAVGVQSRLARDPGDRDAPPDPSLVADLQTLAQELLPDGFFSGADHLPTLETSTEGFLSRIPFAALDLDSTANYQPLGWVADLIRLRGGPGRPDPPARGRMLLVAEPTLAASTRRRFGLDSRLPGASLELGAVRARFPGADVVTGSAATRSNLLAHWEPAPEVFYFLGHAVTDPEVPFMSWLPLAAEARSGPESGLDVQGIVGLAAQGCALVVLSGCATGAPYVSGQVTTPSIGDAFLDAGSGATLQTFWPIRDQDALYSPVRVLTAWRQDGEDLVKAVNDERRRAMQGPTGIRHPYSWAVWTLKAWRN